MSERSDQQRLMDGIYWYGIPTLFRAPHDDDPANADIGLVGIPHSTGNGTTCLLYTSPSPRDATLSRMPSSA